MKKRSMLCAAALAAVLAGCAVQGENVREPSSVPACVSASAAEEPVQPDLTGLPALESPEELEELRPQDFGCMVQEYPTEYESYPLLEGTELENTVYVLKGTGEGPTLYIVGGVHGDELAGWYAGTILRQATVKAGSVYLVAPANQYGAQHDQRKTKEDRDLNRNFPGDAQGNDTQRIAAALYEDIVDKAPALVLDLHEARLHTDGQDNLGNSIICQDIQPIADLVFALLEESQKGTLCTLPLDLYGSPPAGSLNRTLTLEREIPVITVETFREELLAARVLGQLRLAEYVMLWYNIR